MNRHCNYGIHPCKSVNESRNINFFLGRQGHDRGLEDSTKSTATIQELLKEKIRIHSLPPMSSFKLASDEPVPGKDYERLRKDYFYLRLNYEMLVDGLEHAGIAEVVEVDEEEY